MSTTVSQLWQPSTARSVTLDGLLPLPRGVIPADLPPLVWPAKDPGDVLDYELDISAALAGDPTDQVSAATVTIVPSGNPGDLSLGRVVGQGSVAVLWLSAGVVGVTYAVQISVGTLKGRVIGRTVLLPVQQLAAVQPPASPLTTDAGSIITDQNGNPILVGS
jgi:hypothetical protein